jgi:pimeloyl-ACP methyl ester carboxylesterase
VLNVGYLELGPSRGTPVVLLHGFPYDIHSYEQVAPLLARRGCRVIVPYLRGHGSTTFRSASTPRNVDQAAFALDIIAALWPERVKALVSVTGYLITNLEANQDSAAMYARTAAAFDNPDYEAIVIGSYRWRQSPIPAEPEYADRLQQTSR